MRPETLSKRDSNTGVFCETCEIFKNTYFEEHLRKTASTEFVAPTEFLQFDIKSI